MKVKTVMTTEVAWVDSQATVADAARRMRDEDVGFLPVLVDSEVLGVLSDRDLLCRVVAEGLDPAETKVRDVASTDPITCQPDDGVEDAARLMEQKHVRRLVVLDADHHMAGIVSLADLAERAHRPQLAGDVLGAASRKRTSCNQDPPAQ